MVRGIERAVAELKQHPEQPVTAEVDGLVIELRYRGRRTADDIFKEIGPWEGETYEVLRERIYQGRREENLTRIERLSAGLSIQPFDAEAALRFAGIKARKTGIAANQSIRTSTVNRPQTKARAARQQP